ncbi:hypothetical protein F7D14_03865 [Methylocystis parvus]|uniref:Uncharacterized protein n=2 Tax=Methylocystis parvus TaxID=134 RepID=A0A6B8M664_9HYPH|nr:hypothetical protein F7D14_03865 [Methylocystis parvus]
MEATMSDEAENFTLALLRKIDVKVDTLRDEIADVRSEVHSLRADVASDLVNMEKRIGEQGKRLSDQIVGLRRSVMEYHSSAIGHGVLLTELEERVRRLEQHVGLSPEGH